MGFGKSPTPYVAPVEKATDKSDAEIREEAARARELERRRKGRASTILTGGSGDTSTAPTQKKILLGE
jgi:hypothetical protein